MQITNDCSLQIADTFMRPTGLSHTHALAASEFILISETRGNYLMLQIVAFLFNCELICPTLLFYFKVARIDIFIIIMYQITM